MSFIKWRPKFNSLRKIVLNAPRGIIYDRNKNPIVDNKSIYNVNIIPKDFNTDSFNLQVALWVSEASALFASILI